MHHHPNNHVTYYIHANFDDSSAFEDEICQWTDQANGLHTYVTEAVAPIGECKQLARDPLMLDTFMLDPLMLDPLMLDLLMLDPLMLDTFMLDPLMLDTFISATLC